MIFLIELFLRCRLIIVALTLVLALVFICDFTLIVKAKWPLNIVASSCIFRFKFIFLNIVKVKVKLLVTLGEVVKLILIKWISKGTWTYLRRRTRSHHHLFFLTHFIRSIFLEYILRRMRSLINMFVWIMIRMRVKWIFIAFIRRFLLQFNCTHCFLDWVKLS